MTENPGKKQEKIETLPFPMAPIVRLMKKNLDKEKLIKKTVKEGMSKWLAQMCEKVTKEMNKEFYINIHFLSNIIFEVSKKNSLNLSQRPLITEITKDYRDFTQRGNNLWYL